MKGKGSGKRRVKRAQVVPIVDLSCCKYELLRIVLKRNCWEEAADDDRNSHLIWTDMSIGPEKLMTLKRGQKINHYFGMLQICRKKSLARTLSTMRKMFPSQYKFFPRSYILPNQLPELLSKFNFHKIKTFILKPDNGCQGKGVALAQSGTDVRTAIEGLSGSNLLAQKYVANPMLINGYKFDLRIYVLILSCDPLRLYLYREGIVRFCTEKYSKPDPRNLSLSCMHLTNYAVNKHNEKFEFNTSSDETDKGHKWTLTSLFSALAARGYDTQKLHRQISQLVVMTIIGIVPLLVHNYQAYLPDEDTGRTCFELLGMDVLLDEKCKPWLLEVNHSPSFSIDTPLDMTVKEALLTDTLRLVHMDPSTISRLRMLERKGALSRLYGKVLPGGENPGNHHSVHPATHRKKDPFDEYEKTNRGMYDRIYPPDDKNLMELYRIFLTGSEAAFKHSFHMRIKDTLVRVQEERKQEEMAKEVEERKRSKARSEIRKKAQKNARLAALAARAKLVEKLTAKMAADLQSVVAAGQYDQPPTPIDAEFRAEAESHLINVIEPEERSDKRDGIWKDSSALIGTVKNVYSDIKHWRSECQPSNMRVPDKHDPVNEQPTSRLTGLKGREGNIWDEYFTIPLKDLNARQVLVRSKILRGQHEPRKSPRAQFDKHLLSNCVQQAINVEALRITQQYQEKLPALPKGGAFVRANTMFLNPATLSHLVSKNISAKGLPEVAPDASSKDLGKGELPNFTDLMRGQFGLPRIGDHSKHKTAYHRPPRQGSVSDTATPVHYHSGWPLSPASSLTPSLTPSAKTESGYRFRDVAIEQKRLSNGNVFRDRKSYSWLRSPL